jgi:hypothetical protein
MGPKEHMLYRFHGGRDGNAPGPNGLAFDKAGNL